MGVLFARYHVRLYRFIVRLTGNAAMAEDSASDVFLDVWRSARQFQARSQVTTWLLAIARYKTLSALGRRVDETLDEQAAASIEIPPTIRKRRRTSRRVARSSAIACHSCRRLIVR